MVETLVESNCELILRDANLEDDGEITKYTQFQCLLKLNDVGSWQIDIPTTDFQSYDIDLTNGIMFYRDGELLLSGPVMLIEQSLTSGQEKTKITGGTDELMLKHRICYPVVTGPMWNPTLEGWVFNKMRSAVGISTITTTTAQFDAIVDTHYALLTVEDAKGFGVGNTVVVINLNGAMHSRKVLGVDLGNNEITVDYGDVVSWPPGCVVYQQSGGIIDDPAYVGYDTRTGPAESVVKELAYFNAGIGACADEFGSRALPYFTVAPTLGRGIPVTANSRGDELLTQIQNVCASGGINFSVTQQGQKFAFDCYYGNDLAQNDMLVFSVDGGNLKEYTITYGAPSANFVMGCGRGAGVDTLMQPTGVVESIAQYGRIEKWISSTTATSGGTPLQIASNMVQANNLELAQDLKNTSITLSIQENDQVRYLRDFKLGDIVGYQIGNKKESQVISSISYSIPIASGSSGGSAITAALTKTMTKQMQKDAATSKMLQQLVLHK